MGQKNTVATIATIIVAVLALGTTLFLLYQMSQDKTESGFTAFIPSEEVNNEMNDNAITLVKNNCEIFRLYYLKGVPHEKEPYNNIPDDGYYTAASDTYATYSDIEALVNKTFTDSEAKRILTNARGDDKAVYANRDGKLGISVEYIDETGTFKPIEYNKSWSSPKVSLKPVSNTECQVIITLSYIDDNSSSTTSAATTTVTTANTTSETSTADTTTSAEATSSSAESVVDEELVLNATMLKINGEWKFSKLVY